MNKFICIMLIFIICFSFIGCSYTTIDNNGEEVSGFCNYVVIEKEKYDNGNLYWLTYDKTSMICYDIINPYASRRTIAPHLTVKDGVVYYTLYDNGELVPAPMAIFTDSMFQKVKEFLK